MAGRTHDHHARVDPHPELLAPIADDTLDVEDLLHAVPEADIPLGLRTDRYVALMPDLPDVQGDGPALRRRERRVCPRLLKLADCPQHPRTFSTQRQD